MEHRRHYYTLVASLPSFKALEDNKDVPLTRIHLERRLRFLADDDALLVQRVVDVVFHKSFKAASDYFKEVASLQDHIDDQGINDIINHFMKYRIFVALLGRSIKERDLPKEFNLWCSFLAEDEIDKLTKNYDKPDLGLSKAGFSTLTSIQKALKENDALAAEKLLLNIHWDYLKERAFDTGFGLEAVIIYVLQWNILRGWLYQKPKESLEIINTELDRIVEQTEIAL